MHRALVITPHYSHEVGYRNHPQWSRCAALLAGYLSQHGYKVSQLGQGHDVLAELLSRLQLANEDPLLVFFLGHVTLTDRGSPALVLEGADPCLLTLADLAEHAAARQGETLLVLDTTVKPQPAATWQGNIDLKNVEQTVASQMFAAVEMASDTADWRPDDAGNAGVDVTHTPNPLRTVECLLSVQCDAGENRVRPFALNAIAALRAHSRDPKALSSTAWFNASCEGLDHGERRHRGAESEFEVLSARRYPSSVTALAPTPTIDVSVRQDPTQLQIPAPARLPSECATPAHGAIAAAASTRPPAVWHDITRQAAGAGSGDPAPNEHLTGPIKRDALDEDSWHASISTATFTTRRGSWLPGAAVSDARIKVSSPEQPLQEQSTAQLHQDDVDSAVGALRARTIGSEEAGMVAQARALWDAEQFEGAIELALSCLTHFPSSADALQIAASGLMRAEHWEQLSDLYARFVRHLSDRSASAQLSIALSRVCVDKLGDHQRALEAMLFACDQEPRNPNFQLETAAVAELAGDLATAEQHYRAALSIAPLAPRMLRRAWAFYSWSKQTDPAWHAAALLCFIGQASDVERQYVESFRSPRLPPISRSLGTKDFQRGLSAAAYDPGLVQVLSGIVPVAEALSAATAKQANAILRDHERVDSETSTLTVARALAWTAQLLGIACPTLYLKHEAATEDEAAPDATPRPARLLLPEGPAWAVPKGYGRGKTPAELAFFWSTELASLLPDNRILFTHANAGALLRLIEACYDATQLRPSEQSDIKTLAKTVKRVAGRNQLKELRSRLEPFEVGTLMKRALAWHQQSERAAYRLGLLSCGDPELASRQIEQRLNARYETERPGQSLRENLEELARFALGQTYQALRQDLRVTLSAEKKSA